MASSPAICLLILVSAGGRVAGESKNSPVTKVVTLLKDMVGQLQKEADQDDDVYESMMCWCETNDREKTKAIADNENKIKKLNSDIEKYAGLSSQLNTEISTLQTEIAENTKALDTATALRQKQLAEFTEEETDMLSSIKSLGGAVKALEKHNSASLLQAEVSDAEQEKLVAMVRFQLHHHRDILEGVLTPSQRRMLENFTGLNTVPTRPGTQFLQTAEGEEYNPEYQSQSGGIFGTLSAMKESFETNLQQSQAEETTNQQAYEDLKASKTAEIKAGQDQNQAKTALLAETDEKHAQSNEDLEMTTETLDADRKYLASVKEHCANIDAEMEQRKKTRQAEIGAVSKALEFLTSEEAQDLVARTLGFVQIRSEARAHQRLRDVQRDLQKAARAAHDPRLSALAVRVRLDAFAKVRESLQGMIDKLLQEKEDEIKKKDFCVDSLNTNMRTTETTEQEKADAIAKADDHKNAMERLTKEIADNKAEIARQRVELKKATEERNKANTDFQETVADQRATQKLLSAALGVLKSFYEKAALLQENSHRRAPAGPPPPPGFKKYENNAASGGVTNMIQSIVDDAKAMEAEALSGEEQAQQAYEDFVKDTNDAVLTLQKDNNSKTEEKAREEQGKVQEDTTTDEKTASIEQLKRENLDLHADCDYMIKNFDMRLEARDAEVEALKQGLATFSGATFSSFLQNN